MDIKPGHFLYRLVFLTFSISLTYPKHFTKGHHEMAATGFLACLWSFRATIGESWSSISIIQKGRHGGKFICSAREWLTSKVLGYWFTGPGKFTLVWLCGSVEQCCWLSAFSSHGEASAAIQGPWHWDILTGARVFNKDLSLLVQ